MNKIIFSIDIGTEHLGYSIQSEKIFKFGIFNLNDEIKMKKKKKNMCGRNEVLLEFMENIYQKYNFNHLIIEKQVIHNVIAMCLESCLLTFAIMKKISYEIFDPKEKFTITKDTYDSRKKEHKKLSIQYARNIIKNIKSKKYEEENFNDFEDFQKKDDISDAIVMGFVRLYPNNVEMLKK